MKNARSFLTTTAVITAITSAALAQPITAPETGTQAMQKMEKVTSEDGDAASTKAFKEAHTNMMHDMHQTFTGDADVDFMTGMIPHHQGAIDTAKVELKYGKDAEARKLAEKIIADQEKEIAQMKAWLRENAK